MMMVMSVLSMVDAMGRGRAQGRALQIWWRQYGLHVGSLEVWEVGNPVGPATKPLDEAIQMPHTELF
jgi:hypothetical protein